MGNQATIAHHRVYEFNKAQFNDCYTIVMTTEDDNIKIWNEDVRYNGFAILKSHIKSKLRKTFHL